jgi:cell division septum initiation protein DivIVA
MADCVAGLRRGYPEYVPDRSTAAREHAILSEITGPLSTLPDDALPIAADVDFPMALRGYDRLAVDAYVRRTSQIVAELQATHSPEAAVRRALQRVGEEISGILQSAHETAYEVTAQSRREAEDRLERARLEAIEITAEARSNLSELDADTDRIWAERHKIVEDARELARQLLELADTAAARFPPAELEPGEPEAGGPERAVRGAEVYDGEADGYEAEAENDDPGAQDTEPDAPAIDEAEAGDDEPERTTAVIDPGPPPNPDSAHK